MCESMGRAIPGDQEPVLKMCLTRWKPDVLRILPAVFLIGVQSGPQWVT